MAPYKNHSGENKLNQGKKCALYKNDSDQKNRNQTVENKKMAPYKNDCGEKNWATVQDKKMQFIKWLLPKKRSQTVAKNGTL